MNKELESIYEEIRSLKTNLLFYKILTCLFSFSALCFAIALILNEFKNA